jgi:hypothetical protein
MLQVRQEDQDGGWLLAWQVGVTTSARKLLKNRLFYIISDRFKSDVRKSYLLHLIYKSRKVGARFGANQPRALRSC